jgi:hypothetical protein
MKSLGKNVCRLETPSKRDVDCIFLGPPRELVRADVWLEETLESFSGNLILAGIVVGAESLDGVGFLSLPDAE